MDTKVSTPLIMKPPMDMILRHLHPTLISWSSN